VALGVVEDGAGDAPRVTIITGNDRVNAAHVDLASDAFLIGDNEVPLLPQSQTWLTEQRCCGFLIDGADDAQVADITRSGVEGGWRFRCLTPERGGGKTVAKNQEWTFGFHGFA
jgi:hypothetical protein